MVITHSNSTQEKWKMLIYIDFRKLNLTTKKDPSPLPFIDEVLNTIADTLPSPGVNPLEGSTMCNYGKLGLGRRSQLPALQRGRGACQKSRDQTRKREQKIKIESASKTNHKVVSSHSGAPLGVETSHGHFDTQDSPRPGLGGSHHLPPYSILCATPRGLHPNDTFSRDSQVGVLKLSRLESWDFRSS